MNNEAELKVKGIEERLLHMWRYLDLAAKEARVKELETLMGESSFWNNSEQAQLIINECRDLRAWTVPYQELKTKFENCKELLPEAYELNEESFIEELLRDLDSIEKVLGDLEVQRMLSGEMDNKDCYLTINSGAGGTEACDWAQMLSRMYQRWAAKKGWKIEIIDFVDGDVVGLKSITLRFQGSYAYGYSKAEKGVHRLVRISPFDSNAKRHTSFASVDVSPEITTDIQVEIKPEDVRVDTFRSSGAGGQHVNKTDSAVRLTHTPTGIVVSCQTQRSQVQNKEACYQMLRSKLYEMEVLEREKALNTLKGEKKENAWGSQIRNYVFQPYTLVKDTRTKTESGNIQAVMDGELDEFVNAYLKEFG
ncbi:peptide chain release factor 2 [Candidatus Protochlamydia amoebophila]|uniref:peptide chain release factor 2 n=1 Tax=Candidatus Protochlamydia amoebophila TaxID=362787 RepID=UPI001BC8FB79|nr:peptide chain release factor 2 [Candidatus Protochlamydia amoebophila]